MNKEKEGKPIKKKNRTKLAALTIFLLLVASISAPITILQNDDSASSFPTDDIKPEEEDEEPGDGQANDTPVGIDFSNSNNNKGNDKKSEDGNETNSNQGNGNSGSSGGSSSGGSSGGNSGGNSGGGSGGSDGGSDNTNPSDDDAANQNDTDDCDDDDDDDDEEEGGGDEEEDDCGCVSELEGCSHGYWKNHEEDWVNYTPDQKLMEVFVFPNNLSELENYTLSEALRFHGGNTLVAKARILLVQAVAALLNTVHPQVNYPLSEDEIISMVNSSLESENTTMMLDLKDILDEYNNYGSDLCGAVSCSQPDISVEKNVKLAFDGEFNNAVYAEIEDYVIFEILVKNTGETPLDITIRDEFPTGLIYGNDSTINNVSTDPVIQNNTYYWYANNTMPNETINITFGAIVLQYGEFTNFVNVTGVFNNISVFAEDNATVIVECGYEENPNIILNKTVNPGIIESCGSVSYTYIINNTGDVELHNITLTDDQLGNVSLPVTTLLAGESMIVTVDDVYIYETTINTAVIKGYSPIDAMVTDEDSATVIVLE